MRLTKFPVASLMLFLLTHTIHEYGFRAPLTGLATGTIAVASALLGLRIIDGAEGCWKQHRRLEAGVLYLVGIPLGNAGWLMLLAFAGTFLVPSVAYYPVVVGMGFGIIVWAVAYDTYTWTAKVRKDQQSTKPAAEHHLAEERI
jgi:hypothetical protein